MTTKFRSVFTGGEIEEILKSVRDKLDTSAITDSFAGGEPDKIPSAKAILELSKSFDNTFTPDGVRDLLAEANNSNIFTDSFKKKLEGVSDQFKGVYVDITSRDSIDTKTYVGGEVVLVLKNIEGRSEFEYWDAVKKKWTIVDQGNNKGGRQFTGIPLGTTVIASYDNASRFGGKYLIHGRTPANDSQLVEVSVVNKLLNVQWSAYGQIVAGADVFDIDVKLTGTEVEIQVTTKVASSSITIITQGEF